MRLFCVSLLLTLVSTSSIARSAEQSAPFQAPVEVTWLNPSWDPKIPINLKEKELSAKTKKEVEHLPVISTAACDAPSNCYSNSQGTIATTAFKDSHLPVKGKFDRWTARVRTKDETYAITGILDLTSWNSGVPARDWRVMRHVFGVEGKGAALAPFELKGKTGASTSQLKVTLNHTEIRLELPTKVTQEGDVTRLSIQTPSNMVLPKKPFKKRILDLMKACNHQALAGFVQLEGELLFNAQSQASKSQ